jgi:hypothetical protein
MWCVDLGKSLIFLMLRVALGKSLDVVFFGVVCSLGQVAYLLMWCASLGKSLDVVCSLGQVNYLFDVVCSLGQVT